MQEFSASAKKNVQTLAAKQQSTMHAEVRNAINKTPPIIRKIMDQQHAYLYIKAFNRFSETLQAIENNEDPSFF